MLSRDGRTLLFSSDGHGGHGRMDLFTARQRRGRFIDVKPLPGAVNGPGDEFDATFLGDGKTVLFARSADLRDQPVALFLSQPLQGFYRAGMRLPDDINTPGSNTYAPMLDWPVPDRVTFTTRRPADSPTGADLYTLTIRIRH
jgi:hypothetical protein